jgi:cell division protein ZipA
VDNLRWVLAGIGVVIVAGVYFVGRFSTKGRQHELIGHTSVLGKGGSYKSSNQSKTRAEPAPTVADTAHDTAQHSISQASIQDDEKSDEITSDIPSVEHTSFLKETLEFEMANEAAAQNSEEKDSNTSGEEESPVSAVEHASFLEETLAFEVEQEAYAEMEEAVEAVLGPDIENEIPDDDISHTISDLEHEMEEKDVVEEPVIEDEIVDVELPPELAELQDGEEPETKPDVDLEVNSAKEEPGKQEPKQQELILDIEPLVLVLSVMATDDVMFVGKDIRQVLEEEKLEFGDMDVFNFFIEDKQHPIFSVASIIEPGVFDLDSINEYETPGIILFSQLPGSISGAEAFDILLNKSRKIAEKLGGQVCDDRRNRLTEQATTHYRDKIVAFEHDVLLARKKQQQ